MIQNSTDVLENDPRLAEQITHVEELPARAGVFETPKKSLHATAQAQLDRFGVKQLFSHQARAYDEAMAGRDVIVTTGTNSGKSLCYNLPALQYCLTEPVCRCLYLFPTKVLAQDQLGKLEALLPMGIRAATYDGDTPKAQRSGVRNLSHIVITNPDMLHLGILPGHENWAKFFKALRLIVIDEMHVYRGVFGSNVGNVLRRLLRLCEWHHSRPQIIACSATIGNPSRLFERLTGRNGVLIDEDGSPNGKRTFVFYNPPEIGEGRRLGAGTAAAEIMGALVETGTRTLSFCRSRAGVEFLLRDTRKRLKKDGIVDPNKVESYRAGYTPKERRQLEQALFKGELLGLTATNAMELGVDVGELDAVVLNAYPGSASSFWQQSGRAGRGSRDGLAVFVAANDPLDQFLVRQPGMLLRSRNESVVVNPSNSQILNKHILCAAFERPIAPAELDRFGPTALEVAEGLDRSGELAFRSGLFYYPAFESPAAKVNIRSAGGELITMFLNNQEFEVLDRWRAMKDAHEEAIYFHRGDLYRVTSLDLDAKRAEIEKFDGDYYTISYPRAQVESKVVIQSQAVGENTISLRGVTVTKTIPEYRELSLDSNEVRAVRSLDLPEVVYDTIALRIDLPPMDLEDDPVQQLGGYHGLEHALLAIAPLIAACDRGDFGSTWHAIEGETLRPAVYIYDASPGGVGLCEELYRNFTAWARAAEQLLQSCGCENGCPACLFTSHCPIGNETLSKAKTLALLRDLSQNPPIGL